MSTNYVTPPENTCPPGTASTFTEELGRHCVELFTPANHLAVTGMDGSDPRLYIVAGLLILGSGILFAYNHYKHKEDE